MYTFRVKLSICMGRRLYLTIDRITTRCEALGFLVLLFLRQGAQKGVMTFPEILLYIFSLYHSLNSLVSYYTIVLHLPNIFNLKARYHRSLDLHYLTSTSIGADKRIMLLFFIALVLSKLRFESAIYRQTHLTLFLDSVRHDFGSLVFTEGKS